MGVSKVEGNLTLETSALISETYDSVKYRVSLATIILSGNVLIKLWISEGGSTKSHSRLYSGMDRHHTFELAVGNGRTGYFCEWLYAYMAQFDPQTHLILTRFTSLA